MLRRTMLVSAGYMTLHKRGEWIDSRRKQIGKDDPNYIEAVALAGKGAFRYDAPSDLGILRKISPLLIHAGNRWHIPAPLDAKLSPKREESVRLSTAPARTRFDRRFSSTNTIPKRGCPTF